MKDTSEEKGRPTMIRIARTRSALAALLLGGALAASGLQLAQDVAPQAAHAATKYSSFLGAWRNVDSNTTDITRMNIIAYSPTIDQVDVYGRCHPTDCAWGRATLISDGSPTMSATYHFSFATKTVYVWRDGSFLRAYTYTHFIDNSGRKDYSTRDIFQH
jgi:hypothetical protein